MTAPFFITTDQDDPVPVQRPHGPLRTEDPRTRRFSEAEGIDAYVGRDELGFPTYKRVEATPEEQRAQTVDGLRRELEGCERRILELEQLKSHRPPPADWVIADAETAKANVLAELERLQVTTVTEPETPKRKRRGK
jgi:hypothetical protein